MASWKEYERHPLSAAYEDIEGPTWERFLERFREKGNYGRPVTLHEGKVLDGWQLFRAHVLCDVQPTFAKLKDGYSAEEFVEMVNDLRRHESRDMAGKRIAKRRERVAELLAAGMSQTDIAAELGVSQQTISSDAATVGQPTKSTAHVKNGTPSDKPLCVRCTRINRVGGQMPKRCQMCAELRPQKAKKPKGTKKHKAAAPTDAFGTELPARCRDAYCDSWIQDTIDLLGVTTASLLTARLGDGMNKRAKRYPFFDPKDFIDGAGFATDYLDKLMVHLKDNRPAGVCPSCEGKGCADCRMSGLVPRNVYADLKGK